MCAQAAGLFTVLEKGIEKRHIPIGARIPPTIPMTRISSGGYVP